MSMSVFSPEDGGSMFLRNGPRGVTAQKTNVDILVTFSGNFHHLGYVLIIGEKISPYGRPQILCGFLTPPLQMSGGQNGYRRFVRVRVLKAGT
jgi:hypothetical protein